MKAIEDEMSEASLFLAPTVAQGVTIYACQAKSIPSSFSGLKSSSQSAAN